jgi:hypothetical protein
LYRNTKHLESEICAEALGSQLTEVVGIFAHGLVEARGWHAASGIKGSMSAKKRKEAGGWSSFMSELKADDYAEEKRITGACHEQQARIRDGCLALQLCALEEDGAI